MIELDTLLTELEQDRSLDDPIRLRQRLEALDWLETYSLDLQELTATFSAETVLYRRTQTQVERLELINQQLYQTIRREIQQGAGPEQLLRWIDLVDPDRHYSTFVSGDGYDELDVLISGILQLEQPTADIAELEAELVPYQPTPARHIIDLLDRAALNERDVLVDLGSGLGHVPLLTGIFTGARSTGIELEAAYIDSARQAASALNLTRVAFLQQDVRAADLSCGSLFYLYTPFTGTILRAVLDMLHSEATGREIRICTYGPCTPIVAQEGWLEPDEAVVEDRVVFFGGIRH